MDWFEVAKALPSYMQSSSVALPVLPQSLCSIAKQQQRDKPGGQSTPAKASVLVEIAGSVDLKEHSAAEIIYKPRHISTANHLADRNQLQAMLF